MREVRRDARQAEGRRAGGDSQSSRRLSEADGTGHSMVSERRCAVASDRRRRIDERCPEPGPGGPPAVISLKSPREIEIMARGGAILAATLERLSAEVRPGISTKA